MLLLMLTAGPMGCLPTVATNDPVAEIYAAQYAQRASLSVRMSAGAGALAAYFCGVTQEDWAGITEVQVPEDIAELLGLPANGRSVYNVETGAISVTWESSLIDDDIPGTVAMEVRRATESFEFLFTPAGETDEDGEAVPNPEADALNFRDADAAVSVVSCGDSDEFGSDQAVLTINFDMPAETTDEDDEDEVTTVDFPYQSEEEDAEEEEISVVWTFGEVWPESGNYVYTLGAGSDRQRLIGYDASAISGETWPSEAEGRDWTRDVDLSLARGTR